MDLDPSVVWDFAGTLVGTLRERPRQLPATVSRVDPDGTVWLSMPGAEGLVPASTTADVSADDSVTVEWWGNAYHVTGNGTSPSIGTRAASALRRATAAAAKVAGEAKGIADAVGQHFWSDDNGVHVSNEDGNATGERNILMNSLGILLRQGSAWLASFSDSAVAFYDGLGNEAANIVAQFGADGARIGRIGMNRIELSEDGLVQFTDAGVIGIMAGLSATNHTVDVVTNPGTVRFDDVYYYKTSQHDDTYARKTVSAEYPFRSGYPETGVEKLLFRVQRYSVVSGRSSLSTSYEVAVPFGTSYSWQMPNTSYYLKWIVGSQGKGLQLIKETADPYGASHTKMRVYCTGYTTTGQLRSPVLMFGEHSTTSAPGLYAVALGRESTSEGDNAFTSGIATNAASEAQTAIGKYNANDPDNALEVGNGTAENARSNAFAVKWDGTICPNDVPMVDYIIEQGTDGIWTYRKWSSGIAECWGTYTASIAVNTSAAAYGGYRSAQISIPTYPFTFASTPTLNASMSSTQGIWVNNAVPTTTGGSFFLSCGQSYTAANRSVAFHVMGKWQ